MGKIKQEKMIVCNVLISKLTMDYVRSVQRIVKNPTSITDNDNYEIQKLAVATDWRALANIANQTEELQIIAINENKRSIMLCVNPTRKVLRKAVKNAGLKYIPDQYIDNDLCLLAVDYGADLKLIPVQFQTQELVDKAIQRNPYQIIHALPEYRNENDLRKFVEEANPKSLEELVDTCSYELLKTIIRRNPKAIRLVKQTDELCQIALESDPNSIVYIKNATIDQWKAILQERPYLMWVSPLPDKEAIERAVGDGEIGYEGMISKAVCDVIMQIDPRLLMRVRKLMGHSDNCELYYRDANNCCLRKDKPEKRISEEDLEAAQNLAAEILKDYPEVANFLSIPLSDDVLLPTIEHNPFIVTRIYNPSKALVKRALELEPYILMFFENETEEMCKLAVSRDPRILAYINDDKIRQRLAAETQPRFKRTKKAL